MKTKVTLVNDFHNTECNVVLSISENGTFKFTPAQSQKIDKTLCGISDCTCGTIRGRSFITDTGETFRWEQLTQDGVCKKL